MANKIENTAQENSDFDTTYQNRRGPILAKCLILLFFNLSYVLIGGFLFQYFEGTPESVAKCGKCSNFCFNILKERRNQLQNAVSVPIFVSIF